MIINLGQLVFPTTKSKKSRLHIDKALLKKVKYEALKLTATKKHFF